MADQGLVIPPGAQHVVVSFSAEINPSTVESLIAVMAQCANRGVADVTLLLSTPGGSVMHGMTAYNVLRSMPFRLITHNVGNVDSIGNVVFLAGDVRYASPNATFMFHGVGFDVNGPMRFEEKLLKERLQSLLSDQQRIGAVIAGRSGVSEDAIAGFFREQQTKDADYAVGAGIIDEIRDAEIPPGTPVVSLVFRR